jgi:hypothetical protein
MPTYRITAPDGRILRVTRDTPPTPIEARQLLTAAPPSALVAPPSDEEQSYLGAGWDAIKNFGVGGMEFINRPIEFVMGTAAGTAATGSPLKGLARGARAAFEPNLVDSQIRENALKVLEETRPEFVKAHPYAAQGLGLAADVTLDPLNLLFGVGFLRRGGMAALKGLGASEQVAKQAMLVPVGEAFQTRFVAPGKTALTKAAAASPLGDVCPSLKLKTLVSEGRPGYEGYKGLTAEQGLKHLDAKWRAVRNRTDAEIEGLYRGLSDRDKELVELAAVYPSSPQAAQVAANAKLRAVMQKRNTLYANAVDEAINKGVLTPTRSLALDEDIQQQIAALAPDDQRLLEQMLRTRGVGMDPKALDAFTSHSELPRLATYINKRISRTDPGMGEYFFADPKTVAIDPTGAIRVDQRVPNYGPIMRTAEDLSRMEGGRLAADRLHFRTKAEDPKRVTLQEALDKHGASADSQMLMQNYMRDLQTALEDTERVRFMAGEFGSSTARAGYRKVSTETLDRMPEQLRTAMQDVHFPEPMAKDMERYMVRLIAPRLEDGMWGLVTRTQRLWKTMATSLGLPAFQANNLLGNNANMYASGMSPLQIANGQRKSLLAFLSEGKRPTSHFGTVTVGGRTYRTDAELLELARQNNLIGTPTGFFGEEKATKIPEGVARLMAQERGPLAVLNPDWAIYDKIRDLNQTYIEDTSKLAMFIHELRQGKSVEQASTTVRQFLFDYGDLTAAEKVLRDRYIPFYTWMRKNIPLQLATLVQRPAKIAHQGKLVNAFRDWTRLTTGEEPVPLSELPEYLQTGEYVPIPAEGSQGSPSMMRLRLPWFDVGAINPVNVPQQLAERLSPLIRVPASLLQQRDLVTGQTLTPTDLRRPDFLGRFLPTALGGRQTPEGFRQTAWSKQLTGNIPIPAGPILRGLFPMEDQETLGRPSEVLLRSLGATPRVLSPEVLQQAAQERKREATQQKRLNKIASWQGE